MLKDSVFHHVGIRYAGDGKLTYVLREEQKYYSERYDKWVICEKGMLSDGATGALDIDSFAWLFHDKLCDTGVWSDGTPCTNWQASRVCSDILRAEGYWFRARSWFLATWAFGGGKARDNGMF